MRNQLIIFFWTTLATNPIQPEILRKAILGSRPYQYLILKAMIPLKHITEDLVSKAARMSVINAMFFSQHT